MPRYIAFLRGINLGQRRVKMAHLQEVVRKLPVTDVSTFIASGNIILTSPLRSSAKLAQLLAAHLATELGYPVATVVRTPAELAALVTEAPLGDLWADAPDASTQVTLLAEALPAEQVAAINATRTATDALAVRDREIYWRCAVKLTASVLWSQPKLNSLNRINGTTRNLNTLQKLTELYPA